MEHSVLGAFYLAVTGFILVQLLISELRELIFYWKNGWDFNCDSQTKWRSYKGDSDEKRNEISNKSRVTIDKPFGILILFIQMLILIFVFLRETNEQI